MSGEDRLDDDRSGEQFTEAQPDGDQCGSHAVAQHVPPHERRTGDPLRRGEVDEVLLGGADH